MERRRRIITVDNKHFLEHKRSPIPTDFAMKALLANVHDRIPRNLICFLWILIEVVLLCLSKYLNIDVVAAQHIKGERIKGRDLLSIIFDN